MSENSSISINDGIESNIHDVDDLKNIKTIPLCISVSLGTFNIDASTDSPLTEGEIIKIKSDTPNLVNLMYLGQEVGRGELLNVNGRLAVRIKKHWSR